MRRRYDSLTTSRADTARHWPVYNVIDENSCCFTVGLLLHLPIVFFTDLNTVTVPTRWYMLLSEVNDFTLS